MSVRYANINDIEEISKIKVDGWRNAYKEIISDEYLKSLDYETNQRKYNEHFYDEYFGVYEDDKGMVLGFCRFGERQNLELEGHLEYDCELSAIYVKPGHMGKGIGQEMFNFVKTELKKKGKTKMILWVLEKNTASIEFYKKMGGEYISTKKENIGGEVYLISFGYNL